MRPRSKIALTFLLVFISSGIVFGWTKPRPLTDGILAFNIQAINQGRNIYLVATRTTGSHFYFMSSWNHGCSWTDPIQPADTFYRSSAEPDIKYAADSLLHIVWIGYHEGNPYPQIFHQSSSDQGRSWSDRHRAFHHANYSLDYPRLAVNGDTLFLVYVDAFHLRFYRSFDDGLSWQNWTTIDTANQTLYYPSIFFAQGRLHLIYECMPDSNMGIEIYYKYSDDFGLTWSQRVPISTVEHYPNWAWAQRPSAYVDDAGRIIAAWYDSKYGSACGWGGDILARVSSDNGNSWLPESRIIYTHTGLASSCLILNGILHVAWVDYYPGNCNYGKIMYSHSSNWGASWSSPELITDQRMLDEQGPFLLSSINGADTLIHCFYNVVDTANGTNIYYLRNKPFVSTHAPIAIDQPIAFDIKASPNIFTSSALISIINEEGGETDIEIYNLLGQKIWHKAISETEGNIIWDAKDNDGNGISSGTYFVRATSKDNSAVIKLIYLK